MTNDPLDGGGRTQYGISEVANPEAWSDGHVTEDEARAIYLHKYVQHPGFSKLPLILQPICIDWGVASGPPLVVGELQTLLKVKVDHLLGAATLAAIPTTPEGVVRLQNRLVVARVKQVGRIIAKDSSQAKYVNGWLNRALEFLI